MQVSNVKQTSLANEIKIVPQWAWILAVVGFVAIQFTFNIAVARGHNPPPPPVRVMLGLLVGSVLICYLLLIGYVNRDSGRRGMNRLLWTLVAILVTNGLGIILYFILRQPLQGTCPQCGASVQGGFNFCPKCNCRLSLSCAQCKNVLRHGDVYCPYCGTGVAEQAAVQNVMRG